MSYNPETDGKEIIRLLYAEGMIETWYRNKPEGWNLVSGIWSPFYINLRHMGSRENSKIILSKIGVAIGRLIKAEDPYINKVVGLYIAGIPLAAAVTLSVGIPSCYARSLPVKTKEEFIEKLSQIKEQLSSYGHHTLIEGTFCDGDRIAIIDDLVTKFSTKQLALAQIDEAAKDQHVMVTCNDVVVLIDREQGAKDIAESCGIKLLSLIPFKSKGIDWLQDMMQAEEYQIIKDYLKNDKKYQNPGIQEKLRKMASR